MTKTVSLGGSGPTPENMGCKCEFKAYQTTIVDNVPKSKEVEPFVHNPGDDGEYALVMRTTFDKGHCLSTELTINSPKILEVLRTVVSRDSSIESDFGTPLTLKDPFGILMNYWDELESESDNYHKTDAESDYSKHLDLLFEFMNRELKPSRDEALKLIRKGQVAFDNAWIIYRPGEILYREYMEKPWLLVCKKAEYETDPKNGAYLEIHAVYTDDGGDVVGNAEFSLRLWQRGQFPGNQPVAITDLPMYPRKFAPAGGPDIDYLRRRGEKFLALKNGSTVHYNGQAEWLKLPPYDYYDPSGEKFRGVWLPYTETGRVVLDRKTFGEEQRMSYIKVNLAEPNLERCPPFTIGYSLSRKDWVRLRVDDISDVDWTPNAWDALVLPEQQKALLKSLVASHKYEGNVRDTMQQKGKGLVILLHGAPGSGKTLTAEIAAEASKRALLPTSFGELNRSAHPLSGTRYFEKELKKTLQYATTWGAILLFDEADVFLEKRAQASTERNALVAVFLKELEYFSGIVFLTTNRVNTFDSAMKSRIHLALEYSPPGVDARRKIWQRCLKLIPEDQSTVNVDEAADQLATIDLNGREIANAVTTARTVARHEKQPLTTKHLETILEVRQTFEDTLFSSLLRSPASTVSPSPLAATYDALPSFSQAVAVPPPLVTSPITPRRSLRAINRLHDVVSDHEGRLVTVEVRLEKP
ncbi:P-loop containing nucleoside triphosphate hydrolase protein [Xylaria nigripes]|nr:P-loop containing nucleoside triphosphate hydrolase protein [Xylaria nigripes]